MRKINFDNLRKCEDLYNFQVNTFDFENGLFYGEDGVWYPMPITARDLIMQGHYSKPIDENTPKKLTKFNYQSYISGLEFGYYEQLPKSNEAIIELAATEVRLSYFEHSMICEPTHSRNYGEAVGRLYYAWIYIADNVDEFIKVWNIQKSIYEKANKSFVDYLTCENKNAMIEKISNLDRNTPKQIFIILKALLNNNILLISSNEQMYKLYYAQFGYIKNYDTLKRGLNQYDWNRVDKKYIQLVTNMEDYLTI